MKSAKCFLAGMYLHLALSVAVPIGVPLLAGREDGWNSLCTGLLLLYLAVMLLVQLAGWACAVSAWRAARRGEAGLLRTFYILNFLWSVFVWGLFIMASRGILFALLPIPVGFTCLTVVQTGLVGLFYLRTVRRQGVPVSGVHALCQFLPVLDILSTLRLARRLR